MSAETIALLGGTFDPPHYGHLAAADGARGQLCVPSVRLVVAGDPWQKRAAAPSPAAVRVGLVEAALADTRRWGIDGLDVDTSEVERSGATYTVDTVEAFLETQPTATIYLIVGADTVGRLDSWHRSAELAEMVTIAVVPRPGYELSVAPRWNVRVLDLPELAISSTDIRRRMASGHSPHFLTTPTVVDAIERHGLYIDAKEATR